MSLVVKNISASNLPNVEFFSKSDPICIITFRGEERKTTYKNNTLKPIWKKEELTWDLHSVIHHREVLHVGVYDHDRGDIYSPLGFLDVHLHDLVQAKIQTVEKLLQEKKDEPMKKKPKNAIIHFEMTYTPPTRAPVLGREVGGAAVEGEHVEEEEEMEGEGGRGRVRTIQPTWSAYQETEQKHWKRLRKAAEETLPKRLTDFHVRIHIIEARHLVGDRLSPVVKVSCGKDYSETAKRKETNCPFFDETLVFNFHDFPSEMLDRVVDIKLLNTKAIRSDALIGSFQFDLRLVYNEEEHCFLHKWLMLTDPNDRTGATKGYLKISIMVMGPGDVMKYSPPDMSPEDIDIEANLLRPCGSYLQPAVLSVKIYRAEDVPQMDPGYFENMKKMLYMRAVRKEDRVDPYCSVTYGGHKGLTPHCEHSNHPEWNYHISLRVRFPTMCERIQLRLMDRDVLSVDDIIGTAFLHMSHISRQGVDHGFLPTFGPSFINVYGSPREYSHFPHDYEKMNEGKLEGVSYRGRVLVEVEMKLGDQPVKEGKDFRVNKIKLEQLLCGRQFKLHAVFFSATMISPVGDPVEFEVSIGNYGNKLEEKSSGMLSTTPPNIPIQGGRGNYFLPWRNKKPCMLVESRWEDCLYRIYSLNKLLFVTSQLEEGITEVRKMIENAPASKVEAEADQKLTATLKSFQDLITPTTFLPPLPENGYTDLDKKLRQYRLKELEKMQTGLSHLLDQNPVVVHDLWSKLDEGEFYLHKMKNLTIENRISDISIHSLYHNREPQNSIPDVIVWMLSDNKRVACHRIPSHLLMYSDDNKQRGRFCGQIQSIFLKPPTEDVEAEKGEEEDEGHGAHVRLLLWLGPEDEGEEKWMKEVAQAVGGNITSYAETYERQVFVGKWAFTRWTDITGDKKLPHDAFVLPEGWKWVDKEWFISPELSIEFDPDEGPDEWEEEIFEYQSRHTPFSKWDKSYWRDIQGQRVLSSLTSDGQNEVELSRDDIKCREGWNWKEDEWDWDRKRPGDKKGWEYSMGGHTGWWMPYERRVHFYRRRRWRRTRVKVEDSNTFKQKMKKKHSEEGWEYATTPGSTYHVTEHTTDLARRRRLLRRIEPQPGCEGIPPILTVKEETQIPEMYLSYEDSKHYQLRAYLFQARDLYGGDSSGLSDPFVVVKFGRYSKCSQKASETVSPKWDQTLVFRYIELYGDPAASPPLVVVEFFDHDIVGSDDFLGRVVCRPTTRDPSDPQREKPLQWYEITKKKKPAGQLLAFFELRVEDGQPLDLPTNPTSKYFTVPPDISPTTKPMRIEVLCWGVRDMKRCHFMKVTSPFVEVELGGKVSQIPAIEDATKNPNFPSERTSVITHEIELPLEHEYAPPLNILVHEKRMFGITPLIGTYCIKSLEPYYVADPHSTGSAEQAALQRQRRTEDSDEQRRTEEEQRRTEDSDEQRRTEDSDEQRRTEEEQRRTEDHHTTSDPDKSKDVKLDWWTRYYYSIGETQEGVYNADVMGRMEFHREELEKKFGKFQDLVQTFPLFRGRGSRHQDESPDQIVGYFKGAVKVYSPGDIDSIFTSIPSTKPVELVVRVYIVRGINLQPKDSDGKSDPYIVVKVGRNEINDRDKYIPGDLNPIFGRMYELPAKLPLDHTLTITVMDWDRVTADDLIGSSEIDLEDRFLSRYRATCGLPDKYFIRGPFKWRDRQLPSEILKQYCLEHSEPPPEWSSDKKACSVGERQYKLSDYEWETHPDMGNDSERLALYILGTKELVSEHIETRKLYNPLYPKVPQGELHMWVDIFQKSPKFGNIPRPVDISPRKPEKYILRVIVWNTKDVKLDDNNPLTRENMSDIYVKGWLSGQDETQKTDVHYRSMDGEGNFNWRFVFPFKYIAAEQKMVIQQSEHFYSLTKTERRLPTRLTLQVWDNDLLTRDDFLGTIDFDLHSVPQGAPTARSCSVEQLPSSQQPATTDTPMGSLTSAFGRVVSVVVGGERRGRVNLFQQKQIRGWWPVVAYNKETSQGEITGKLELELEVLHEDEAIVRPAGKGREEPNMNPRLEEPNRPATSFLWITSPFKTFRFIVWRYWKWYIIGAILLILAILLIVLFVYAFPGAFTEYLLGHLP